MRVRIPQLDKRWRVAQKGDFFGNIQKTRSTQFDDKGRCTLSKKPNVLYTNSDDSTFTHILAVLPFQSTYLVCTSDIGGQFELDPTDASFTYVGAGSGIYQGVDAVVYNGLRFVSRGPTTVSSLNATSDTWTDRVTGLASGVPHPLAAFENLNQLAVGNGNKVQTYNTSYSLQETMVIPDHFTVMWLRWRQNNLYIGTKNNSGEYAKVFVWNGIGSQAQAGYSVNAEWSYSGAEYASSITTVTSAGQLLRFNGGGFDVLANFPIFYTDKSWLSNETYLGKVFNRGMIADGDLLYINIDGSAEIAGAENDNIMPSGVWCFDPDVGLYHRSGYSSKKYDAIAPSSVVSDVFTMASAHGAETGDAVYMSNIGSLTGLTVAYTYYAIRVSDTTLKLALTPADAKAGNAITIGGSVGSASFLFDNRTGVGTTYDVTYTGAITTTQSDSPLPDFYGSDIIFGGMVKDTDGTTDIYTLQSLGLGRNVGSFNTTLVPSQQVTDIQQKLVIKYEGVNLDTDKIVAKYRVKKRFGLPTPSRVTDSGLVSWSSNKVLGVDDTEKHVRQAEIGDEVEVISGAGAGRNAHISSIREASASVREFTLDETIEGVSSAQKSEIMIDNWTKLGEITNDDDEGYKEFDIGTVGKEIEVKVELRGLGVSVEEVFLVNEPYKRVV